VVYIFFCANIAIEHFSSVIKLPCRNRLPII